MRWFYDTNVNPNVNQRVCVKKETKTFYLPIEIISNYFVTYEKNDEKFSLLSWRVEPCNSPSNNSHTNYILTRCLSYRCFMKNALKQTAYFPSKKVTFCTKKIKYVKKQSLLNWVYWTKNVKVWHIKLLLTQWIVTVNKMEENQGNLQRKWKKKTSENIEEKINVWNRFFCVHHI